MNNQQPYPIGKMGTKWGESERHEWLAQQSVKRSYQEHVLAKLQSLPFGFAAERYGALAFDSERYPLIAIRTRDFQRGKPMALITGGVHGYETSGVQGAIRFIETEAASYADNFNIIVTPCISPWAYETINRWNPYCIDPNRSFFNESPAEESATLQSYIDSLGETLAFHIDLHETTDTDNSEFRPALAARDNVVHKVWDIPDGFYLVGDTEKPVHDFQAHIIKRVSEVTHIALADENGRIIGEKTTQPGVINYANKALGLCAGFSGATYSTTTEVYPDSPTVDAQNCIQAQVTAVCAGLDYVINTIAAE